MFRINSFGQTFSLDFLIGLSVFILVFFFVSSLYSDLIISSESVYEEINLETKTFIALEFLFNSKGNPENWFELNSEEINSIGLLGSDLTVSEEKLIAFINLDYEELKEKIGLQGKEYFFSFSGKDSFETGIPLLADLDSVALTRIVAYKGGEANVKLVVYKI